MQPTQHVALAVFAAHLIFVPYALCQQPAAQAPAEEFVRAHYTKYEYRIPMRDGVRLFTAIYVPKAAAFPEDPGPYPFLMERTPYSVAPYGEDRYPAHLGPSDELEKSGYIFVYQDVRGRWMSQGAFAEMRPHIDEKKSP
ncbi:MAG: CocE/NonD family hydrolase, partial [Terracidiphilus sp.]